MWLSSKTLDNSPWWDQYILWPPPLKKPNPKSVHIYPGTEMGRQVKQVYHHNNGGCRVWTRILYQLLNSSMVHDHWAMFSTEYYSVAKTYIIYSHTLHNLIIQTIINTDHLSLNNKQILGGSSLNHTYRTKNTSLVKRGKTCSVIISDRKRSRFQQNWLRGVRTTPVSVLSQFVHSVWMIPPRLWASLGCCLF